MLVNAEKGFLGSQQNISRWAINFNLELRFACPWKCRLSLQRGSGSSVMMRLCVKILNCKNIQCVSLCECAFQHSAGAKLAVSEWWTTNGILCWADAPSLAVRLRGRYQKCIWPLDISPPLSAIWHWSLTRPNKLNGNLNMAFCQSEASASVDCTSNI